MDDKYFGWRSVHPFVTRNFMLYNCSQTPLFLSSSVAMGGGVGGYTIKRNMHSDEKAFRLASF